MGLFKRGDESMAVSDKFFTHTINYRLPTGKYCHFEFGNDMPLCEHLKIFENLAKSYVRCGLFNERVEYNHEKQHHEKCYKCKVLEQGWRRLNG